MKPLKLLIFLIFPLLLIGFIALGFIDIPIQQQDVTKEIPHDKIFGE